MSVKILHQLIFSKHIQFQPLTPKDIVRIAEVEVSTSDLYQNHEDGRRTTAPEGPLDGRMVSEKGAAVTDSRVPMRRAQLV